MLLLQVSIMSYSVWPVTKNLNVMTCLARSTGRSSFETCPRCFPQSLVGAALKYIFPVRRQNGRRQSSLSFTVTASSPKLLEELCQNIAYEFFSMSKYAHRKTILVRQQIWPIKSLISFTKHCNKLDIALSLRPLIGFFKTCLMCLTEIDSGPPTNMIFFKIYNNPFNNTVTTSYLHLLRDHLSNWATSWQNQQNECAPSEDSDQPGHPPSLIRVFAVRSMGS